MRWKFLYCRPCERWTDHVYVDNGWVCNHRPNHQSEEPADRARVKFAGIAILAVVIAATLIIKALGY